MKLKKSYLLIAIAIFLLISIGSVCASENITDDSDVQLADDGTDVVLSDTDENVPDETANNQEQINTTVETEKEKYEFKEDSNKTFKVEVKDNKSSNPLDVNKSDLSVMNGNKNISFDYTGKLMTITEKLPIGNYNLTINYLGNENYINSTKVIAVKIYGNNTIETVTSVVCNGKSIAVPVTINDQVENITELVKDSFNLTLVYTNETGSICNLTIRDFDIINNTIKFDTNVALIAASLIIDYANATEPKTVDIKVSTEVQAQTSKDKFKSEEIKNISIKIFDGQGNLLNIRENDLKVLDNGANIAFKYNNTNLTLLELGEGVHNLTIEYQGNESYNASSTNITIKVSGKNQINTPEYVVSDGKSVEIPVTLFDGAENINLTKDFNLTLTYTNKSGNITTVNLTSADYEITADGKLKFNVESIKWIKAGVNVDYVNSIESKNVIIYLQSSVKAEPATNKYKLGGTDNITVTVYDNEGIKLNITKNDLKVYDNGREIDFTFVNGTLNVNLEIGVHNLTIAYKGNDTYNSSSVSIERKVNDTVRFNPDESVVLDESAQATITINLNDGADPVDIDKTKLNITVFWTLNNQTQNKTININDLTINGQNVTFKMDVDFDSAYAAINYSENNLNATTKIKANTKIDVNNGSSNVTFGETEEKTLQINVTGQTVTGHAINITKDNIQVLKDGKALTIEINNVTSIVTIKDALKAGVYNLTIKYLGEDTFLASSTNITLTVYGINATASANINSTKKGEVKVELISGNETVPMNVSEIGINVTYKNGNNTVVIPVTLDKYDNGTLYFTLENGNFTSAILTITYGNTEKNVTLNRIYNAKIEVVKGENEYKTGNFTFKLIDVDDNSPLAGKEITLYTVGNIRIGTSATTNSNGIVSYKTANLYGSDGGISGGTISMDPYEVGLHEVELSIDSSKTKVYATTLKTNLTITPANIKIVLTPYKEYYGANKNVSYTVTNSENEPMPGVILKLTIEGVSGTYYLQTNSEGKAQISIYNQETKNGLVGGEYKFTASNNDTKNINNITNTGTVTVVKIPVTITAKDKTVYYNSGTTSTITIKDKNGKAVANMYVLVIIDGNTKQPYLFQTNSKGQISFSASLAVGKHKITISSADNRYSAKDVKQTITVKKASAKITSKKVTAYYKGGKYLTVKLTNTKTKKAIYDGKLNIKIFVSKNRYYNYNGATGMNGKLKLLLDSLKPGKYKVVITGNDNKNFAAKKITTKIVIKKAPAKIKAKKLTAKKGAKKYFKITVKNKKTKKAISKVKVKVKVYTGKKSKTYTLKTNTKGIAKLNVKKLKVGKHKVVISSADKYVVAKKAKSTIKIKK
ncbi:hypothetical protein [Methanobrevibacter sp.]